MLIFIQLTVKSMAVAADFPLWHMFVFRIFRFTMKNVVLIFEIKMSLEIKIDT